MVNKRLAAPGLKWRKPLKDGTRIAYWICSTSLVKAGYPVRGQRLWAGPGEPSDEEWTEIIIHCHRLTSEMKDWTKNPGYRRSKHARRVGKIYFVLVGDHLKIGFTSHLADRIRGLQAGSVSPLKLLATIDGNMRMEESLHLRFRHLRDRGEWFRYEGALREFVEQSVIDRPALSVAA